jgi:diguanylate cyclase (GGDEF)-like protein
VYDARPTNAVRLAEEFPVPDDPAVDVIANAARTLARSGAVERLLDDLLAIAVAATGSESAVVFLQDPDRADLEVAASAGMSEADLAEFAGIVAANPEHPIRRSVAERIAGFDMTPTKPGASGLRTHLPLVVARDEVDLPFGVLALAHPQSLDGTQRRLVAAIADLAAVGIDRARLASLASERSEWYERMAHMDPLTGLANGRTFARVLELEIARAGRQGSEVSVAVFDVDDFRTTNADAGHAAGDDILREVAAVLAESVRLVDTVARYGGDEFVLVAPGSAGMTVARRVLSGVAKLGSIADRRVSVSAGVARFPADGTTADELLAAAERALAEGRSNGAGTLNEASSQPAS